VLLQTGYLDTLGSSSSSSSNNRKGANGYGNGSVGGKSLPSFEELSSSLVPPTAPTFACVLCGKRGFRCVVLMLYMLCSVATRVVWLEFDYADKPSCSPQGMHSGWLLHFNVCLIGAVLACCI
jgi:hypothetical protein